MDKKKLEALRDEAHQAYKGGLGPGRDMQLTSILLQLIELLHEAENRFMVVDEHELLEDGTFEEQPSSITIEPIEEERYMVPCGERPSRFRISFIGSQAEAKAFVEMRRNTSP